MENKGGVCVIRNYFLKNTVARVSISLESEVPPGSNAGLLSRSPADGIDTKSPTLTPDRLL